MDDQTKANPPLEDEEGTTAAPPEDELPEGLKDKYIPVEEYKKLQRKLSAQDGRRIDEAVLARGVGEMNKRLQALQEIVLTSVPADSDAATKLRRLSEEDTSATAAQQRALQDMAKVTQRHGVTEEMFASPEFDDVRDLWQSGRFDAAIAAYSATAKMVKQGKPAGETKVEKATDPLEAEVQRRLRAMGIDPSKVDTKGSETPKKKAFTRQEVLAMDSDSFLEHFDEILDAVGEPGYRGK